LTCLCKHVFGYASFLFFWHTPWACGLPSLGRHLLFSFCIALIVLERIGHRVLILWNDGCDNYLPVWKYSVCTWSWSREHDKFLTGVEEFDKGRSKSKHHLNVGHENVSLALVGIHDNLRSQAIFILFFWKRKQVL
jgi:hypothetical protein